MAHFSAYDILTLAEKIEQNGSIFYSQAADMCNDENLRSIFLQLSEWEKTHERMFAEMKKNFTDEISDSFKFDPSDYVLSNPPLIASLAEEAIDLSSCEKVKEMKDKKEILTYALKKEKGILVFFNKLKDCMRNCHASEKLNLIIQEENRHVGIITQSLERLTS
jgi:rubrerythrin